jgi:long-chain fatty acid transport protein
MAMNKRGLFGLSSMAMAALMVLHSGPAAGAGFGLFEQGAKAMGMAGAFTAQADDPSLFFYNVGGLGLANSTHWSLGAVRVQGTEGTFQGAAPSPGPAATGEQYALSEAIYNGGIIWPVGSTWKLGGGLSTPFGLETKWKNPRGWAGRFLNNKAAIRAIDLNPALGWQVTPNLGIGVGAIIRSSDLILKRDVPRAVPGAVLDIAGVSLESDMEQGYGWNVGLLHRVSPGFSWGLSYRSKVEIDYEGDGRFTQHLTGIPAVDAAVPVLLPLNQELPIKTSIEFPDMASLGLAFGLSSNLLLETDVNWTGWSSFDQINIRFTGAPALNSTVNSQWDDAYNYRAGLRWTTSPTSQWRFGAYYDETPQPEESVGPLLPDANRKGLTLGYGYTGAWTIDAAVMWVNFDDRTRNSTFPGEPVFNGTYKNEAWLFGLTFGH